MYPWALFGESTLVLCKTSPTASSVIFSFILSFCTFSQSLHNSLPFCSSNIAPHPTSTTFWWWTLVQGQTHAQRRTKKRSRLSGLTSFARSSFFLFVSDILSNEWNQLQLSRHQPINRPKSQPSKETKYRFG